MRAGSVKYRNASENGQNENMKDKKSEVWEFNNT